MELQDPITQQGFEIICKQLTEKENHIKTIENKYINTAYQLEGRELELKEKDKQIKELNSRNVDLIGKIAFTENALNNAKAQIEKMKCCDNCNLYQCAKWKNGEINYHYAKYNDWKLKE